MEVVYRRRLEVRLTTGEIHFRKVVRQKLAIVVAANTLESEVLQCISTEAVPYDKDTDDHALAIT